MTGRKAGWWIVRGGWVLTAGVTVWLMLFSGTDPASTILFAAALLAIAVALLCVGRAVEAHGVRERLMWIGRTLALLSAAVAIGFPAVLYQEIAMLISQGCALPYDIEAALWYEAATMPLVVVPALIALRSARLGGVLFLLDGVFYILMSVYQPFGKFYPEATSSGWIGIPLLDQILQPAFVTAALLLIGSTRAADEQPPGSSMGVIAPR